MLQSLDKLKQKIPGGSQILQLLNRNSSDISNHISKKQKIQKNNNLLKI